MAAPPAPLVEGSPLVYGIATRLSTPAGRFDELVAPGALAGVLRFARGVPLVRDHDPALILGFVGYGVELVDEPLHLDMTAALHLDGVGRETLAMVRRGELRGMSFSATFSPRLDATWHEQASGVPLRVIHRFRTLADVSVVTRPAYPTTCIAEHHGRRNEGARWRRRVLAARIAASGGLTHVGRRCQPPAHLERALSHRLWRASTGHGVEVAGA